jgi:aryl-alcohol dehydrogenase-like predicted oxidoreductase
MPQVTSRNPDPIGRPRIVWGHPPAQRRTDRVLVVHPRRRRRRRAGHRPRARHRLRAVLPALGRGFLSGRIRSIDDFDTDDFRRSSPRFQGENFTKNLEVLDQVVAIAERKGVTPSQLALAWVLAQGTDIVPIPGTRRIANLQENVAAVDIDLSADDLAAIDQVTPAGVAAGERYAPAGMQAVHR